MSHHNRTRQPSEDDEEDDPLDRILKKSGCADLHYKVQFCMAEKQDWRQCQVEVKEFRECVEKNKTKPPEKTWGRGTGPYPQQICLVDSRHPKTIRIRVIAGSSRSKSVVNILFVNIFCTLCIYSYNINHFLVIYLFIFYIWRLFFTIHKVTNAYLCELFSMVKSSYLRNKEPFFAYNEIILGWSNPMKPVGLIIDLNKADGIWSS